MLISAVTVDLYTFQLDNAPAHETHERVQLLTLETPNSIAPTLASQQCEFNPADYMINDIAQLKSQLIEESEHFNQMN